MHNRKSPQVFTLVRIHIQQVTEIKRKRRTMENTIRPLEYSKGDLNPHNRNGQGILSPSCLPIPPFEHPVKEERKTRLELATLTLARLCSTN